MKHLEQSCMSENISRIINADTHETEAWKHKAIAVKSLSWHLNTTKPTQPFFKIILTFDLQSDIKLNKVL